LEKRTALLQVANSIHVKLPKLGIAIQNQEQKGHSY